MPSPYANVGGGPGGPDDSFLGLDSGNFWSRFGLPEPGGPPPIDSASPMGPVDPMPNSQTPMTELEPIMPDPMEPGAPLDAMYSMIGMPPLTADSMGRYNLTDDQKSSASRNSFANTLGTAAQVMFGTASADDMVKAGLSYGINRDAALDRSSATNKADYETKVEMAVKGSNLMRQQVLVEAEQERLKEIMEQKEYGAEWVSTMEPVWEKYANELAATDPDRAKQYAASLQMVRAKALTGDMTGATMLFDAASNEMIPSVWKKNQEEDMVKAQFARAAEFTGFKEADEALQATMPGWRMGMKDGKAVPMSPQDQAEEAAKLNYMRAQANHLNENAGAIRGQAAQMKAFNTEVARIEKVGSEGINALYSSLPLIGAERTEKNATAWDRAQGDWAENIAYLEAAGAISGDPSTYKKQVEGILASPAAARNILVTGARKMSPTLMAYAAGQGQQGEMPNPAQYAGTGGILQRQGTQNPGGQLGLIEQGINGLRAPIGPEFDKLTRAISVISHQATKMQAQKMLDDKVAALQINTGGAGGGY